MTYAQNMQWLLGSVATRTAEEKKNNTDVGNWIAKASVEEGKFLQKVSGTAATLIKTGHEQWRKGQQSQAVEDWYANSVNWDPNSDIAKGIQESVDGAVIYDTKQNEAGVEARKEGVDGNVVNMYAGKSAAYTAQIAKLKLSNISGGYEAYIRDQFLNNTTQLKIEGIAPFAINETSGLANPEAKLAAHKYLRQQFFAQNGINNFSEEFLNHSGFFKSIHTSASKITSEITKEADIVASAQKRHLASITMGQSFSAVNVDSFIKATANGIDENGDFIGYEKAWENFEDWVVKASNSYDIDSKDIAKLANSVIPSDPKGLTYLQKYPTRFSEEGTLAQKLHGARKARNTREDEKATMNAEDIMDAGLEEYQAAKGPEAKEQVANKTRRAIIEADPFGTQLKKWDDFIENKSSSAQVDYERIKEVLRRFKAGELVDLSKDNYVVTSNEDVKKAKEHSERIKKSDHYKEHFDGIEALLKQNDHNGGYNTGPVKPLRGDTGGTVKLELQQMFHKFALEEEAAKAAAIQAGVEYKGTTSTNAFRRMKEVWTLQGGGGSDPNARYYLNVTNGEYPNIGLETKRNLNHNYNTKKAREIKFTERVNSIGNGDVEKALSSSQAWLEPSGDNYVHGINTPPETWNINKYLSENKGNWPAYIHNAAQAMGRSPYQVANARQQALFGEEIPIEYNDTPNRFLEEGLTSKEQENVRTGTTPTWKMIENGKWIRNSIMEGQGVDQNEADNIFLREMMGPVGQEISYLSDDSFQNTFTMAALTEYLEISPTALDDFQEGSAPMIFDAVNSQLADGGDPHAFLTSPTSKMLMAEMTGDLTYLLRMPMFRDEIISGTSQVEPTAEPQPVTTVTPTNTQTVEKGGYQDTEGRKITYTNSIPKQYHGLQEGETFTDSKGRKWILTVTSGSGSTVVLGRKRAK